MLDLTPSERKGAIFLLALVAIGAVADLLHHEPVPAPEPVNHPAPAAALQAPAGPAPGPAVRVLDLNAASITELDGLPGIGPVLAARIVAHREAHGPFRGTEELLAVRGIGPRLLERLGARVTVRAQSAEAGDSLQFARRPRK